jgi:hypothetical protein
VTVIWLGVEGDELVVGHPSKHQNIKNILRDPRVAISLQANTKSALGLTGYAVLYGKAQIQEGGAPELLQRLAAVYLGPSVKFPPLENLRSGENPPSSYVTRIRMDTVERCWCMDEASRLTQRDPTRVDPAAALQVTYGAAALATRRWPITVRVWRATRGGRRRPAP